MKSPSLTGNSSTARTKAKTSSLSVALAGSAWLFADERFDHHLDYLFIDEAGQVAVANVVAMGTAARNIVLVGDQMQLGQPVQGVHPGKRLVQFSTSSRGSGDGSP